MLHGTKPSTHVLMLEFFVIIIQVTTEFEMQSKSRPVKLEGNQKLEALITSHEESLEVSYFITQPQGH